MTDRDGIQQRQAELGRRYPLAYDRLRIILFVEDPIGISDETNADEYEPEVGTILPRLCNCSSADDIREVVHEEFVKWFDVGTAGPPERYQAIAKRVWAEVLPELTT